MAATPTAPPEATTLTVTFFYYRDLALAMAFHKL
jgi:hypothetical protein